MPAIGATGGSLAYTCSNTNGPGSGAGVTYDGLTGGYLGLGIDEYGNFLNQGDNTASGYGFQPGRIGLRGAGAISWPALNNAYGADPGNPARPFYPAWLSATCSAGSLDTTLSGGTACGVCPTVSPTTSVSGNVTTTTSTATTYVPSGTCTNTTTTTVTTTTRVSGQIYRSGRHAGGVRRLVVSGTYSPSSSGTYPNGYCWKTVKANGTCAAGFTKDTGLNLCTTTASPPHDYRGREPGERRDQRLALPYTTMRHHARPTRRISRPSRRRCSTPAVPVTCGTTRPARRPMRARRH